MTTDTVHYRGRYLALREVDGWEYASRTNAHGVAVIIAVTDQAELVLVEQFRKPVGRSVLELPAGLVGDGDEPDEDLVVGAGRELEEETGFRASQLERWMQCPSSAGLTDEMITFFIARGLRRTGPGGGDESEDIRVHLVALDQAEAWLRSRSDEGIYLDPKIYTALYLVRQETGAPFISVTARDS